MDKEFDGVAPKSLDNAGENSVHTVSLDEVKAVHDAEKEKKEEYYVDPLEQEARMKEKLQKIDESKKDNNSDDNQDLSNVRPDMNVSGFFSAGNTAKKSGFMKTPASALALKFSLIFGVVNAIYSAMYLFVLVSQRFDTNWFLGWLYGAVAVISFIIFINGIRSLKIKNDNLRRNAIVGILGAIISFAPLVAWIVHWITVSF